MKKALLSGSFGGMALARGPGLRLTACFATSRFATAAVWTAAAVSLRSSFCHNGQAQALSIGQVAMRLGASGGSLLGGLLLSRLKTWRKLLAAYAALGAVACAALAARLARSEWEAETEPRVSGASDQSVTSVGTALKTAFKTPRLWLLFGSTTMITPTFDFVALLPQFLHDMYKLDDVSIGSLSGAFPLSAPPAILLAGTLLPALTAHGKAAALLVAQTCSAGGFFLLSRRPARSLLMPALVTIGGGSAPALSCIPPDWIMRWGGPRAGLFAGLHDVPGNLLAMFIYSQVPRLLQRGGWPMVLRLYALQVALGAVCLAAFQAIEAADPTVASPFARLAEELAPLTRGALHVGSVAFAAALGSASGQGSVVPGLQISALSRLIPQRAALTSLPEALVGARPDWPHVSAQCEAALSVTSAAQRDDVAAVRAALAQSRSEEARPDLAIPHLEYLVQEAPEDHNLLEALAQQNLGSGTGK
ncbi:unnamed protein product [Effrenium voratum]|nr:unnamed protein product [Effrenium voratum]